MKNELITFKDGTLELNVPVSWEQETVWITRNQMAELFDRDVKTIGKHINNALKEELDNSTVANFATVQMEGGREVERNIEHYNLDMILPTVVLVSERLNPFNPSTSVQYADSGDVFPLPVQSVLFHSFPEIMTMPLSLKVESRCSF